MKLNEIVSNINQKDYDNIVTLVHNCSSFFEQIHYKIETYPMFRGFQGSFHDALTIKTIRKNRKPLGSPIEYQQTADDWFEKEFGMPVRSQCCFVSGDTNQAFEYGNTFCVIPKGKFSFFWSPVVNDFTVSVDNRFEHSPYYTEFLNELGKAKEKNTAHNHTVLYRKWSKLWCIENQEEFKQMLTDYNYQDTNLEKAIESGNEIAIVCDEVYVLNKKTLDAYADEIRILSNKQEIP